MSYEMSHETITPGGGIVPIAGAVAAPSPMRIAAWSAAPMRAMAHTPLEGSGSGLGRCADDTLKTLIFVAI